MQLILPGIVALCTDIVGFITMLVIEIQTIRELAITASLGVGVIIFTNFFLLPLLVVLLLEHGPRVRSLHARLKGMGPRAAGAAEPHQRAQSVQLRRVPRRRRTRSLR